MLIASNDNPLTTLYNANIIITFLMIHFANLKTKSLKLITLSYISFTDRLFQMIINFSCLLIIIILQSNLGSFLV